MNKMTSYPAQSGNRDVDLFQAAKFFLVEKLKNVAKCSGEQAAFSLDRHIHFPEYTLPDDMTLIFKRYMDSAKNFNMMPGVFKGDWPTGEAAVRALTSGYDPRRTLAALAGSVPGETIPDARLNALAVGLIKRCSAEFGLRPERNEDRKGLWNRYFRALLSGAAYLSGFATAADFYAHLAGDYADPERRLALPKALQKNFVGLGEVLVADWLKELGYEEMGKPDVHIIDLFTAMRLAPSDDPLTLQRAMRRIADANDTTVFAVDKVFWLIGSGKFYRGVDGVADTVFTGENKDSFLRVANHYYPSYGIVTPPPTPAKGKRRCKTAKPVWHAHRAPCLAAPGPAVWAPA